MRRTLTVVVLTGLAVAACTPAPSRDREQGDSTRPSASLPSGGSQDRTGGRWTREAEAADRAAIEDASGLLRAARDALADPRGGVDRVIELLERAESRLLTRSTARGDEQRPMNEGPQARISGARRSLGGNDRQRALREISDAIQDLVEEQQQQSNRR